MKNYIAFQETFIYNRKTKVIDILAIRSGVLLGQIRWHSPWRQYCFFPEPHTIFSVGCMCDIQDQINQLMAERRKK